MLLLLLTLNTFFRPSSARQIVDENYVSASNLSIMYWLYRSPLAALLAAWYFLSQNAKQQRTLDTKNCILLFDISVIRASCQTCIHWRRNPGHPRWVSNYLSGLFEIELFIRHVDVIAKSQIRKGTTYPTAIEAWSAVNRMPLPAQRIAICVSLDFL